jgi:hypothetical protein
VTSQGGGQIRKYKKETKVKVVVVILNEIKLKMMGWVEEFEGNPQSN